MNALTPVLNKQLANWIVTEMKVRNFHWHVKGPQFFTLHAKFEEFYNEAGEHIDELAERIRTFGDRAVPTLGEALKLASVQEEPAAPSAEQMAAAIVRDFGLIVDELQAAREAAEAAGDEVTHDLLLGIEGGLQKHIWMLNAFAGE